MIDPTAISNMLKGHGLVLDTAVLERGHLRLETAFRYPDGSQIDLFLAHEPDAAQGPAAQHVEHSANAGGRGDLDRAHHLSAHLAGIDLIGVSLLDQVAVLQARDGDKDDDHILQGGRQ